MENISPIWYSYPALMPKKNAPLEVLTSQGVRQVIADYSRGIGGFSFTDCTHPAQNMNCDMYAIDGWRYKEGEFNTTENIMFLAASYESQPSPWYIRLWQFFGTVLHPKTSKR